MTGDEFDLLTMGDLVEVIETQEVLRTVICMISVTKGRRPYRAWPWDDIGNLARVTRFAKQDDQDEDMRNLISSLKAKDIKKITA